MKRKLTVTVLAVAALVLAGCQAKAGAAAVVAGQRIQTKSLNRFVGTATPTQAATVRTEALEYLVRTQLFSTLLARHGGVPSDSQLNANHDKVLPSALNGLTGSAADTAFVNGLKPSGFAPAFVPMYLRSQELAYELGVRKVNGEELCGEKVSINPRYGAWDWSVSGIKSGVTQANFLTSGTPRAPTGCKLGG